MDYQKFIEQLPQIYDNWGENNMSPKIKEFLEIEQQIEGEIKANLMALLNLAVANLTPDEIYCQIGGIFQGKSLIGALLDHPEKEAYAVEILEGEEEDNLSELIDNLVRYKRENQVSFCSSSSLEDVFLELRELETDSKIGVVFYQSKSDYRSQLLSLLLVKEFLAEQALIIIYNSNYSMVQQACCDFLLTHPQSQLLLDLSTPNAIHYTWGNGVYLIAWEQQQDQSFDEQLFKQDLLNQPVIQAISDLHDHFEFKAKPQAINLLVHQARNLSITQGAIEKYREALTWNPYNPDIYYELGVIYYQQRELEEASQLLKKAIELDFLKSQYHYLLGIIYFEQEQWEEAINVYKRAIEAFPKQDKEYLKIYSMLIRILGLIDQREKAIKVVEQGIKDLPNEILLKLENINILPYIYENEEEINVYRQRFTHSLDELLDSIKLNSVEEKKQALESLKTFNTFMIHCQGKNDLEIQIKLGNLRHKILKANYPQYVKKLDITPLKVGEKIRIGYVSAWFRNNNSANWALDWIKNTNREEFAIYCYYTDQVRDNITEEFQQQSDFFEQVSENIEEICQKIIKDRIHILIYPDIGTVELTTLLAGLRLAPIQCTAWGGPVTSGLPTIDYYLSSDLMEPENGQDHYSEQLVRLPNLGLCYPKIKFPQKRKNRQEFNLDDQSILYLSSQNYLKYLPQYDYVFPSIAVRVPHAKFVFIASHINTVIKEKFIKRLQKAFADFNLDSQDYCLILPVLSPEDYLNLNLVSDIYLDTFDWSGGNTTMQAIASNLPIVTCPGEFMRGRHSYGMLKMLGVEETIAKDESEYIDIAVRLGLDEEWRNSLREKTKVNQDQVYNDKTCVKALEDFFRKTVRQPQK
ncbi:Tetratricopeptide TPR_2 repeat protein [Gloeothece citriformis PCC 7424]|uniref:protein O-GlcNAc transferase n=1 Tax=Gloeothece citriformis (strain PCC 7424) TaxID=65393 RepID=B7KFX2_GLOC7|nr:tetratricopeptide repeat protein [Gloeothece citriformis]ACK69165.1 Tetratricopeptide TPR_2 repeat protein [Gloeothece citriformis PCC 7424]